jgi:hypothetical protein
VKHSCRPRKKILGVRRIVASLVHRVASECTNGVQRRPPTQRDDFTAIRVEISHGAGGTKVSGCAPIACYTGRADVLYNRRHSLGAEFQHATREVSALMLPLDKALATSKPDLTADVKS